MEIFEIIKALCPKAGVSGAESEAAKAAAKEQAAAEKKTSSKKKK